MRIYITGLLMVLSFLTVKAQNSLVTISGSITDAATGETLIAATIAAPQQGLGTVTNEYGFYSLKIPAGDSVRIEFSYVGYQTINRTLLLNQDQELNIELKPSGVELEAVEVKANSYRDRVNSTEMSVEIINTDQVKVIPLALGESDILKVIQLKPGIPSGSEGTTGIFVRGGGSDQNLIVLDEAVVYNPNHLFGFFSTFNTDAVKDLKIYKGGFPAQYGGRLSSVIDVKLKEGNYKKFSGSGGVGLIASRLTLEGPLSNNQDHSFIVSGRRTYIDLFTRAVNSANADNPDATQIPDYFFYDLNTKINFKLGEKDRLFLSGYFGRDQFGFESDFFNFQFDWGNATGTARWNHVFNPQLFVNTTLTYSDYQYNIVNEITDFSFNLGSNIRDLNFKTDFYNAFNNQHTLRYGANATWHNFNIGRLSAGSEDGLVNFSAGQEFDGLEFGAYLADEIKWNDRFTLNTGLRISGFNNDGEMYFGLEPRVSAVYKLREGLSAKASYARMYQYLHLVATSGATLPTDIWYPSTERIKPQRSDQVAAGLSYLFRNKYLFNVEGFYKDLDNQLELVDGAEIFANDKLEEEFAIGEGEAYGVEFSVEKQEGKLQGWIGYTLSRTVRSDFKTISPDAQFLQELPFSPIYDRRHDLSIVATYQISKRLTASATFVYGSGDLRWLPEGRFSFQDVDLAEFQSVVPDFGDRNNYRLPDYHRLDLGLVWKFFPKWGESDLTFSVINVYDRRNTFFLFFEPVGETIIGADGNGVVVPERIAAQQVSLFPILPAFTYNFKF
jgi:outer membrane cobalamin receptor